MTEYMEIKPRLESDGYDTMPLRTGEKEVTIQPDWNNGKIRVQQQSPMPLAILSIIPDVDFS